MKLQNFIFSCHCLLTVKIPWEYVVEKQLVKSPCHDYKKKKKKKKLERLENMKDDVISTKKFHFRNYSSRDVFGELNKKDYLSDCLQKNKTLFFRT